MDKIAEEKETLLQMITIYCHKKHGYKEALCNECRELKEYAFKRLEHCVFAENKGTCGSCKIHCYKGEYRKKIKLVMRFSGPRMIFYSPIKVLKHLLQR